MIGVEEALQLAKDVESGELPALSEREQTQLDYMEATIDAGIYKSFTGGVFDFRIPTEMVAPLVIAHLKRLYEAGGWLVGMYPGTSEVQVIFAPSGKLPPKKPVEKKAAGLPGVVKASENGSASKKLLVRMPTRGRPVQALSVLEKYRNMAGCDVKIEFRGRSKNG